MSTKNHDTLFEQCLKCSVCTVYCPVMAVNAEFPGPKHAGVDEQRFRLQDSSFRDEALKLCLNCKRCEVACPSGVPIGDLILRARLAQGKEGKRLRGFILSHNDLVGSMASAMAPIVNPILRTAPVRYALDAVLKVDHRRIFPKYAGQTFRRWMKKESAKQKMFSKQVAFFHGCYVNYNNPQLGRDLVKVFNHCNIGVELIDNEKCCGIALLSNGFEKDARAQAQANTSAIRRAVVEKGMDIVATSSTCAFTLRDEYPHILSIDNSDIRNNIELATRYLYKMLENGQLSHLKFKNTPLKIAYHTPCHMERMGWSYYSIELMKMIPSVELTILESGCCGIAGTYGFKSENYPFSQQIGNQIFKQINQNQFDFVVSDCETCKWQIEMSTNTKCEHPITLIARMIE